MARLGKPVTDDPTKIPAESISDALNFSLATVGEVTVNGATPVTVTNKYIAANSIVLFGLKTVGGTVGATPTVKTKNNGTSFNVAATASDTSVYTYAIINPGNGF